ncbi:MAG: helix-turn-helix transcriptional regulator [Treponema sp.]|nr:helix-turn-helix transcriptional regulator [Treponema sp.]
MPYYHLRRVDSTLSPVCGLAMLNPGWTHIRRCLETESVLLIGKKGHALIEDNGLPFEISEGKMLLLPAGHIHRGLERAEKPLSYWWFHFYQGVHLDDEMRIFLPKKLCDKELDLIFSSADSRLDMLKNGIILPQSMEIERFDMVGNLCGEALGLFASGGDSPLAYNNAVERILLELGRQFVEKTLASQSEGKSNPLVKKILESLEDELSNPNASVKFLADQLGLNADYLGRAFKESMNVPLGQYISRRRVELACSRLCENNDTIEEVARDCGFGSRRQFFEVFRQFTGKTPASYRADSAYVGINAL